MMKKQLLSGALALIVGCALALSAAAKPNGVIRSLTKDINASGHLDVKVKAFAVKNLIPVLTNRVLVKETVAQNGRKATLDAIKKIDDEWKAAEDELPVQKEKLGNASAAELRRIVRKHPQILEVFVMDDQGAVVGENQLTSDYWQGDEAKWQNSYKGAKGGLDVGKRKFDKSANAQIQQVSLPLVTADGKIVGAITFGLDVGRI